MAIIPPLRPPDDGSAEVERSDVLRQAAPVRAAAVTAVLACAFLAVAALVGLGQLDRGVPSFLSDALGPQKAEAPLERTPAPGVGVRIHSDGYTVSRWGDSVSLVGEDLGGAEWRRHVHGVTRTTDFGEETIVVDGQRTEKFLTVTERQGEQTWRWKLATRLVPRLGRDGAVAFLDPTRHRVSGLVVDPVRILDGEGEDITPSGLRWGLEREQSSWWLTLELDDRDLPLPYVIDPAVSHRAAQTATTTGAASLVVNVPAGIQANDLLVAHIARVGNAAINTPTGWTAAGGTNNGSFIRQATYYRVAGGSEPASYTWTWTGSQAAAGGMSAYYGVKASSALDVVGTAATANNTTTITAPSLTTTTNDALVLAFFGSNSNSTYSTATGMTERHDVATAGMSIGTDDMSQATAGATGSKTSTASASGRVVAHQLSFNVDDVAPTAAHSDPGSPLAGTIALTGFASDADSAVASVEFQHSPAGAGTWTNVDAADTTSPYSASFDTTTVADGLYDLRVVATDVAGNVTNSTAVADRRVDNSAPTSTTTFPASSGTYNAAGWNAGCGTNGFCGTQADGAGSGVQRVELSIRQGAGNYWNGSGFASASEVWNTTTLAGGSWSYAFPASSFPADGAYAIRVRAVDNANNTESAASRSFTHDTTAPQTTVDSSPSDPTSATGASFDFSASEGGSTFECRLDGGSWSVCTSPESYSSLSDGSHTFDVRATDAAGNTDSTPAAYMWVVDTAAPSSSTTFPAGAGEYNAAGWNAGCATSGLCGTHADGTGSGVERVELSIRQGSGNYWNGSGFASASEVWNTATLAGGDWTYGFPASSFPAEGGYTMRVRAVDNASNAETATSRSFTYDATAPQTTIDSSPADPTSATGASFDFSASEGGSSFECRLDGGSWASCASPESYAGLSEGSHTFDVRATDAAGNTDPSPASFTWLVDTAAPSSTTSFPAAAGEYNASGWNAGCPTSGLCGTYSDGMGSGVATVEVSIRRGSGNYWDGSGFTSASEIWDAASLAGGNWSYVFDSSDFPADGSYTVRVRATDDAGLVETPSSRIFAFDTTDPSALLSYPTAGGEYRNSAWSTGCATAGFCGTHSDATSGVAQVQVSVERVSSGLFWDGDSFDAAAETFFAATLAGGDWSYGFPAASFPADGSYTVHVRATDDAGNTEGGPSRTFAIDNTDPSAVFAFPAPGGAYNVAGWDAGCATSGLCGTASDTGAGVAQVEVSLERGATGLYWDGDSFDAAGETFFPATLAGGSWSWSFDGADFSADGSYTAHVRGADDAGNVEVGPTRTFAIDTAAPQTTIDSSPSSPTSSTSAAFGFSASEGGVTFECRLDGGSWSVCTSPESYTSLADGGHTFDVRATDSADNTDASPATHGWTVDTTAPSSTYAFPVAAAELNGAGWNAGCATSGLCGGYADATSGVDRVEISLRRASTGLYWNGASFSSAGETFFTGGLSGGSWSHAFPASSFPADGDYTARVFATDEAGNVEAPSGRTFTFDATAPAGSLTAPADGADVRGGGVTVSSDSADSGSGVASAVFERRPTGGGAWTTIAADATAPYSAAWDTTSLADEDYDLRVVTTDDAGNSTTSATRTVTVDNTAPSAATLDALPAALREGHVLTGSGADAGSGVASLTYLYCEGASCSPTTPIGSSATGPDYDVAWNGQPGDGLVRVLARVEDGAGNTLDSAVQQATIDNTNPTGSLTAPAEGAFVSGTVAVASDSADAGAGVASAAFERRPAGGGSWTAVGTDASAPYSVDWETNSLADGDYELRVVTTDAAGNAFTSALRTVAVDNNAPTVSITAPAAYVNGASADPFTVTATSPDGDLDQVELFRCSNASAACGTGSWFSLGVDTTAPYSASWPLDADGNRALRAVATDGATNTGEHVVDVTIDRTDPTGSLTAPADGAFLSGTVAVSSDSADTGAGVASAAFERRPAGGGSWAAIGSDGGAPYSIGWDTTLVADGDWELRVVATDAAGNAFASGVSTVMVDNADPLAPVLTLSESSEFAHAVGTTIFLNTAQTGTYDVNATSSDAGSGLDKLVFPGGVEDGSAPYGAAYDFDELSGIRTVTAHDNAGNTAGSDFQATADVAGPAAFDLTAPAAGATIANGQTVSAAPTDAGAGVAAVEFRFCAGPSCDFDDGTPIGSVDTTAPFSVSWSGQPADGEYTLVARATDHVGNATDSGERTVTLDSTGPDGTLSVNEGTRGDLQWLDGAGSTLYYNPAAGGDFTVQVSPVDPVEVQSVDFPAVAETGFSGPAMIDLTPPFESDAYGFTTANTDAPDDLDVVVTDLLGNPTVLTLAFVRDTAAPAGGSVSYPDGYDADGEITILTDAGSDTLAGLDAASTVLERRTGTISDGTCDPFAGAWSPVTSPDTVPNGQCAQYRYRASDNVANEATYTSGNVVKIDTDDPTAPALTLTETSAYAHASGTQIYLNTNHTGSYDVAATATDPASGIAKLAFPTGLDDTSAPYTATYDFDDLAPTTHTVTAHDNAGNTNTNTFDVTADTAAPATTDDTASIGSSWQTAPVTVTLAPTDGDAGVAATYYTTDGSAPTTSSDEGTSVELTADGVYTIRYFSVDRVGNDEPVRTGAATIRIDRTSPDAPAVTLSESSAYAHVSDAEIFLNTGQAGTYTVSATSSDATSGLERIAFPGGVDDFSSPYAAVYAFGDLAGLQTVTAHDVAGSSASDTFRATPDTAAPAGGFVSYPDGYDVDGEVTITFGAGTDALAGVDAGSAVLERRTTPLVEGVCDPFSDPWSAAASPDTVPTDTCALYRYRVSDRVGNEAVHTLPGSIVKVDLTAPQTTVDTAPSDPSSSSAPTFEFSADEGGSTFQCRLDGGAWSTCTSPETLAGLADGSHTFQVRATDAAGTTDPTPASHTWTVDTAAPQTTLEAAPADPSADDTPSFGFSASESGSTFECRVDGGAWAACSSPQPAGPLADGPHTFDVRASDAAGNLDATPAQHAWTVDTTAPETTLDLVPADPSADDRPGFEFSADEGGSTFQCRLDGGAWSACTSPETLGPLADGPHTFDVRATDTAGNTDATPAQHAWDVNAVAPTVSVVQPNGFVNAADADPYTVRAASPDGDIANVELFRCSDDSAGCATGSWVSLGTDATAPYEASWPVDADGTRALRAVATDLGSNTGEDVITVTIDRTVPATSIDSAPNDPSGSAAAVFAFSSDEAGAAFECRIDAGGWTPCASPESYAGLSEGGHAFSVRASDAAGNVDSTPPAFSWTVDTVAPDTMIDVAPSDPSSSSAPTFEFSADEGGSTFQCRLDGGAWSTCTSPETLAGLADGSHTFQVRATDAAGTTDPTPASRTWTVDATPPGGGLADPGQYLRGTIALGASPTDTGAGVQSVDFQRSPADAGTWTSIDVDTTDPHGVSWDTTAEADGLYDLRAVATDNAGNSTPSAVVEDRVVDNTAPGATMDDPGAYLRATVSLTSNTADAGSGVANIAYERSPAGAASWTSVPASWDTTAVADGLYDLRAVVTDNAGNSTTSAAVGDRRVDNTKPSLAASMPADGSTVAAAGSLAVVAGEDVAGIANAQIDGAAPPAAAVAGDTVTFTSAFANGPHVLAGELEDLAGNRQEIRVHFTAWSGATLDYPYVEKNSLPGLATSLRSASDTTTLTIPSGAWSGAPVGDWLVLRLDPLPAAGLPGGFTSAGEALDATAYWALAGGSVTSFSLPLELEIDNALDHVIPATYESGDWRAIAAVPDGGGLPASWGDGFERDGLNVRILTRHLSRFTLLRDVQAPTVPGGFRGTLSRGTLGLAWSAASDNSGLVSAYRVYANGAVVRTVDGSALSTGLGAFNPSETRSFQIASVDEAGNPSAKSYALRVVPKVTKLVLSAAKRALAKRGFKTGKVTLKRSTRIPQGKVIAAAATGLRRSGSKIALSVSRGAGSSRRPVTPTPAAPTPPVPPTGTTIAPPPAPARAVPPPPAPRTADAPGAETETVSPGPGGRFALPFVKTRSTSLSELRHELGFGLLVAAFSVAFAAGLRARRPFDATGHGAEDELLWDARLLRGAGRLLRRLAGRS